MTDKKADSEPTLIERWLQDQQGWQKTAMAYLDSMVKSEQFLTHLGNAMRGSLLAGKPYPTPGAEALGQAAGDDRMDEILNALHKIQGQLADLTMSIGELQEAQAAPGVPEARKRKSQAKQSGARKASKASAGKKRLAKKRKKKRTGDSV